MKAAAVMLSVLVCAGLLAAPASAQDTNLTPEQQKAFDMRLRDLDRSALEPQKRELVEVAADERNPFGLLAVPREEEAEVIQEETEESKIRRVLANMRVNALIGDRGSYSVVLGSFLLTKGDEMPRLFQDQAERLMVEDVTDRRIVFRFVERGQRDIEPRKLAIYYDLKPRIRNFLVGELWTSIIKFDDKGNIASQPVPTASAAGIMKAFENEQLREALVETPRQLLGESWPEDTNGSTLSPQE